MKTAAGRGPGYSDIMMNYVTEEIDRIKKLAATPQFQKFSGRPVVYLCSEFAFPEEPPRYAGGLGVLAGDMIREAADRGFPMVAVGLYYRQGYVCPAKEIGGKEVEICDLTPPPRAGFEPVLAGDGKRLRITVPVQDREVAVRAWKMKEFGLPYYVLDTDCEENSPADRRITDRLYIGDRETRLKQEIILGIGGFRLLEALDIHPSIYHLNEGHSALLVTELIRHEMQKRHIGFDEAKQFARRRIVMTNHTLLPAGNEIFADDLVSVLLQRYAGQLCIPMPELIKLGLVQQSSQFSMSMLAFRMAGIINAVSRLHAKKAKEIWQDHPMVAVTNGVHVPTWDAIGEAGVPGKFWPAHQERKAELLAHIAGKTSRQWKPDELLIGWARRIVGYKRPMAIFEQIERLCALVRRQDRPVRLVFSGHPHPSDADGEKDLWYMRELIDTKCRDFAVYLPGYGMPLAKLMTAGCDLWLNTPVVGFEASGTSGMKAGLNGVLNCTTQDGWIDEADMEQAGWLLDSNRVSDDLLDKLEKEILPAYFERNGAGLPEIWEKYMLRSRQMILDRFTATRMLREYIETLYM